MAGYRRGNDPSLDVVGRVDDHSSDIAIRVPGDSRRREVLTITLTVGILICIVVAILWVLLASAGASSANTYDWNFGVVTKYLPILWTGLKLTLALSVLSIILGTMLGIAVAILQMSPWVAVRWIVTVYIEIMRGTPMLVQLVWFYYALPILTGVELPAFQAVIIAFTLNSAAFYGEAFRSGIQSLPKGQVEAATILGLTYAQRMRYVIVPQGFRNVLPVLVSIGIQLFKDTSLVSTLGVAELMYNGQLASTYSFRPLEVLTAVAAIYFAIAFPVTLLLRRLEVRLSRHRR